MGGGGAAVDASRAEPPIGGKAPCLPSRAGGSEEARASHPRPSGRRAEERGQLVAPGERQAPSDCQGVNIYPGVNRHAA